jgi:hypothetical protein
MRAVPESSRLLRFPLAGIALHERIDRVLFWLLVAGLAWCPFWFGSHDLIAWGINALIFPALTAIYELSLLVPGERHSLGIKQIGTPSRCWAR